MKPTRSKIGIYAGTFDPIHNGHIDFAMQAISECGLHKVVFLPERSPRRKQSASHYDHRMAMVQLVIAGQNNLAVQTTLSDQFTVKETLPFLQHTFAGCELYLLVGSDVAGKMTLWPGVEDLFATMKIVVGMRAGDVLPALPITAHIIQTQHDYVAASNIRRGQSSDIRPDVREYIAQHNLYEVQ